MTLSERAITCLAWLMCFSLEFVEARKAPRTRAGDGPEIARTVQIRQATDDRRHEQNGERADYSHRFETRGHFRHHFEFKPDGTANQVYASCLSKDPKRQIEVDGKPCCRSWVPLSVKGLVAKPFVPQASSLVRLRGKLRDLRSQRTDGPRLIRLSLGDEEYLRHEEQPLPSQQDWTLATVLAPPRRAHPEEAVEQAGRAEHRLIIALGRRSSAVHIRKSYRAFP